MVSLESICICQSIRIQSELLQKILYEKVDSPVVLKDRITIQQFTIFATLQYLLEASHSH